MRLYRESYPKPVIRRLAEQMYEIWEASGRTRGVERAHGQVPHFGGRPGLLTLG